MQEIIAIDLNGQGKGALLDNGTLVDRVTEGGMIKEDDFFLIFIFSVQNSD
jgi:hypothetical protein